MAMPQGEKFRKASAKGPQWLSLRFGVDNGSLSDPRASSQSPHRCDGIACVINKLDINADRVTPAYPR